MSSDERRWVPAYAGTTADTVRVSVKPSEALEVDVDRQRADFLHQHIERLRHPGFDLVLALDDVLVDLGPAVDVVELTVSISCSV